MIFLWRELDRFIQYGDMMRHHGKRYMILAEDGWMQKKFLIIKSTVTVKNKEQRRKIL